MKKIAWEMHQMIPQTNVLARKPKFYFMSLQSGSIDGTALKAHEKGFGSHQFHSRNRTD